MSDSELEEVLDFLADRQEVLEKEMEKGVEGAGYRLSEVVLFRSHILDLLDREDEEMDTTCHDCGDPLEGGGVIVSRTDEEGGEYPTTVCYDCSDEKVDA